MFLRHGYIPLHLRGVFLLARLFSTGFHCAGNECLKVSPFLALLLCPAADILSPSVLFVIFTWAWRPLPFLGLPEGPRIFFKKFHNS